jgi:parvulin-like peptidyl-prolyl isomerase
VAPEIQKAGFSPLPAVAKGAEVMKGAVPQIKVVALVGATNLVTDQEVIEAVHQNYQQLNAVDPHLREAKEKEMYAVELRKIIARELILDEMYTKLRKAGKLAAIDDIKEYSGKAADFQIRMIRRSINTPTDEAFADFLRTQGLTVPVMRRQFERETMAREYIRSVLKDKARTPGLADIRDYYDKHSDEFKAPDKVKWLDIFISFSKHPTPRAAYDHAEGLRQKAASGSDFGALSKEFDDGLSGPQHGLGIGSMRNEIKPVEVEPTVWALRAGEVSGLIQTPVGYHIVKVVEREYAGVRPLDAKLQNEIRDKLTAKYRELEEQKMIEELWRKGPVRIIEHP